MSNKTLDRIGALLMKAERTDSEAERDALVAKAQELATLAAIDLEAARQRQRDKTKREQPVVRGITLFEYDHWQESRDPVRSMSSRSKGQFVNLFLGVGRANDVQFNIYHDSSGVIAFGMPSDIDVTEALYASLSVQMKVAADAYIKRKEYRSEMVEYGRDDWWSERKVKPMDGRTARRNFYEGFVAEVSRRLHAAKETAMKATALVTVVDDATGQEVSTSGELVLVGKREEVSAFYKEKSTARGSWRGGQSSGGYSGSAWSAGTQAGSRAHLSGARGRIGGKGVLA